MAIGFILLALLVQTVGLVVARHRAAAIAAVAVIDASLPGSEASAVRHRAETAMAAVPGATDISAAVVATRDEVAVRIRFRWIPPGPDWLPLRVGVAAAATRVVPP